MNLKKYLEKINDKNSLNKLTKLLENEKLKRTTCALLASVTALSSASALEISDYNNESSNNSLIDSSLNDLLFNTDLENAKQELFKIFQDDSILNEKNITLEQLNTIREKLINKAIIFSESETKNRSLNDVLINKIEIIKAEFLEQLKLAELSEGANMSNEEKIAIICSRYNLTREQFEVICAVILSDCDSYVDAYAAINSIYNCSISSRWVNYIKSSNLYNIVTYSGLYSKYGNGEYKEYLNASPEVEPGKQAVIDFLFEETPKVIHNYSFWRSNGSPNGVNFSPRGNVYYLSVKSNEYLSNNFVYVPVDQIIERQEELRSVTR